MVSVAAAAGTVVVVEVVVVEVVVVVVDGTVVVVVVGGTVVVGTVVGGTVVGATVVVGTVVRGTVVGGTVVGGAVVVGVVPAGPQAMPFSLQFVGATHGPAATYPMVIELPAARSVAHAGALTVTFCAICEVSWPPQSDEILGTRSKVSTQFRWATAVGLLTVRLAWCPVPHEFTLLEVEFSVAAAETPVIEMALASTMTVATTDRRARVVDRRMRCPPGSG
jgi:hypothetical protein